MKGKIILAVLAVTLFTALTADAQPGYRHRGRRARVVHYMPPPVVVAPPPIVIAPPPTAGMYYGRSRMHRHFRGNRYNRGYYANNYRHHKHDRCGW